uniref:Uncharacterized protein n=1 Tax=Kalanchoe fedtschenkoi TaxID=63787 RepID=A0A7N0TZR8_KALFE
MVLSNKKLKQKLRASVSDSITESVSSQKVSASSNFKELIGSATNKPRLSKREKRRSNLPLLNPLSVGVEKDRSDKEEESAENGLKVKKRKRNDEGVPISKNNVEGSKKSTKKKKKKKKKGKAQKSEAEEEKGIERRTEQSGSSEAATASLAKRQENTDTATKVYVGGIPYYSTEDDIRSNFESCGTITEVFCMTFPDTGKFRGIAIIGFKTEAAAKRALGFDGTDMGGLLLKVKPYKMPKTTIDKTSNFAPQMLKGYNRIYVGNLSWDITEDALRNLFSDCSITSIRFGTDKETGEFRGYAHVDFSDSLSLTMALKLDQQLVCGRPAKISYAVPPQTALKPETEPKPEPTMMPDPKDTSATAPETDKKKIRRKCYLCGEKGHLSSSCLQAQNQDQKNC